MVLADQTALLAQRKADWLEQRKSILSATQAAIVWVAHNGGKLYKGSTPRDVWLEKRGEAPEVEEDNLHFWVGNAMERPLAEWVARDLGADLEYPEPYTLVYAREERRKLYPWLACTPDGYAIFPDGRRDLIECKTTAGDASEKNSEWGEGSFGPVPGGLYDCRVPPTYFGQVTYQLAVCEAQWCHLGAAMWLAGRKPWGGLGVTKSRRRYTFMRVPLIEAEMLRVLAEWWHRYISGGRQPPVYK